MTTAEQKANLAARAYEQTKIAWMEGYVAGLRAFAWWKDGEQFVGTCGTTLAEAIEKAEEEFSR